MNRDKNATLLDFSLIALGFVLRDAQSDQRSGKTADSGTNGPAAERRTGYLHRAVPVPVGLDDGHQAGAPGQVGEDALGVGAHRAQVDFRPAQVGRVRGRPGAARS